MNFVHCNVCYKSHNPSQLLFFYMSNCGHLYCENCIDKGKSEILCNICKKKANIIKLDKNIPVNIQDYFLDRDSLDAKTKMIKDFQYKQINNRLKYLEIKLTHYNQLKLDYRKLLIELQNKDKQLKQLQNNLKRNCGSSNSPNKFPKRSPMPNIFQKYPSPTFSARSGNSSSFLPNKNLPPQISPFGITQRQHQPAAQMKTTRPTAAVNRNIHSFRSPQQYATQSTAMNSTMNDTFSQKYNPISFLARWSGLRPN